MKIDLKKELKHLYNAPRKVVEVDVPAMNFLMVAGYGDPNTSREYVEAIQALYTVSYTLKFMVKQAVQAVDYAVMPLEGLWWVDDMSQFSQDDKDAWQWTAMIMQPEFVTQELFHEAVEQVKKRITWRRCLNSGLQLFVKGLRPRLCTWGRIRRKGRTLSYCTITFRTAGRS